MNLRYDRIVLKLSGESLGSGTSSLDQDLVKQSVKHLVELHEMGVAVAVVVGGGNFFRGNQAAFWGIDGAEADEIGMIATGLNASLIAGMLREAKVSAEVFSRGPCLGFGTPYRPAELKRALDHGSVTLLAGGMGVSGVSTDVAAVHSAADAGAQAVIMSKFGTDAVYTADPRRDPTARRLPELTASYALEHQLAVMDRAALALMLQHQVTVHVVGADLQSAARQVVEGAAVGSIVTPT